MAVRLLLDEDVRPLLAEILRNRGYDVHHVLELGRTAKTDDEQLSFALAEERAILTVRRDAQRAGKTISEFVADKLDRR